MAFDTKKIRLARRVIGRILRRYKWRFLAILCLGLLSGLSAAIGIAAIIPLFTLLVEESPESISFVTEFVTNAFSFLHIPLTPVSLILFILLLFVLKSSIKFLAMYVNEKTFTLYEQKMREDLFARTMETSWPYLLQQKIGFLEKILMRDLTVSTAVITQLSNVILLATSILTYAFVAFNISSAITLITFIIGVVLFFVFKPFIYKSRQMSRIVEETEKEVAHLVNENIIGGKTVKAFAVEDAISRKGKKHFKTLRDKRIKIAMYQQGIGAVYEPIGFAFIATLFLFYHTSPMFDLASFVAIIYLIQKLFSFAQQLQNNAQVVGEKVPYLERLFRYRDEIVQHQELDEGTLPFAFENEIAFEGISFSYEPDRPILSKLALTLTRGDMIGFIGESGGGKTTVVDLLLRLFSPDSGTITIDGEPINRFDLKQWREHIGYVPQDTFLLNDTVANNIRFYDKHLSMETVRDAAQDANIHDFIDALPDGYDTVIGERGTRLSGGQRQRIALARALARNPEILILDEATSALDSRSESLIQESIERLKGKVTVLIIAHRLSTIMSADSVIVIEDGQVREHGRPSALLADTSSKFFQMYHVTNSS